MSDRLEHFAEVGVMAVTFAEPERLAAHEQHLGIGFPVYADPGRELYGRFGLGRGSVADIWNVGTLKLYARLLRSGRRLRRPTEDTRQLGGDFVVDADGTLVWGHWPRSPDDRPSVDDLIAAVRTAR
ncbi:MAG: hypothetical protein KDB16_04405 [Acidimicrobiales bacterium]|nr:hypothetical protein [Acidimicrobiales bacterium]